MYWCIHVCTSLSSSTGIQWKLLRYGPPNVDTKQTIHFFNEGEGVGSLYSPPFVFNEWGRLLSILIQWGRTTIRRKDFHKRAEELEGWGEIIICTCECADNDYAVLYKFGEYLMCVNMPNPPPPFSLSIYLYQIAINKRRLKMFYQGVYGETLCSCPGAAKFYGVESVFWVSDWKRNFYAHLVSDSHGAVSCQFSGYWTVIYPPPPSISAYWYQTTRKMWLKTKWTTEIRVGFR